MGSEEVTIMRRKKSCKTVNCEGVKAHEGQEGCQPACKSKL